MWGSWGRWVWEEQRDAGTIPGRRGKGRPPRGGNGRTGELASRTDRSQWLGVGEGREEQMPELGTGCLEHRTPFPARKAHHSLSRRRLPGPEERLAQAGRLAPRPPHHSPRGPVLCFSQALLRCHSCSGVPLDKGPAGLTVRFPRGLPPGQCRGETDG